MERGYQKGLIHILSKNLKKKIFSIVILNYLNKIGTSQSIEEIHGLDSLIELFDLNKFSKNSVFFDPSDIERLNSKYIKRINIEYLDNNYSTGISEKFWGIIRSNVDTVDEAIEWDSLIKEEFNIINRIILEKNLKKVIKESIPTEIKDNFWDLWTSEILKKFNIKPKKLFVTLRLILTG